MDGDHVITVRRCAKAWLFDAYYEGEKIVSGSKQAEFAACRVLKDRGLSGSALIGHEDSVASFRMTLERGAALAATEGEMSGPKIVKWAPFEVSPLALAPADAE